MAVAEQANSVSELLNLNRDTTVSPAVMVFGGMAKNSTSGWEFLSAVNNYLMVSGSFTTTSAPLSASSSNISAVQGDAGLLRVSAVGGTAGDRTLVDGATQTISATLTPVSASPASTVAGLVTNNQSYDAGKMHVSSLNQDANFMHVSAFNPDAGLFHVSSYSGDANQVHVSAVQGDSGLLHVSAILAAGVSSVGAASFGVSAAQIDAGSLHASAYSGDANQLHVSSVQGDAGLQHVSSFFGVDTTGQWTIGRLSNLSSSGNIKAIAGTVYGYYAYNTTTIPAYINFTNTSGAINVGTDPVLLKIMLPASAAANVGFPGGLKGFTNGIGVYAVSAIADNATTSVATSAVGINLFYN